MKQNGYYSTAELVPKVKEIFAQNGNLSGDAVQRSVVYEDYQNTLQHCITRIDVLGKGELPPEPSLIDYRFLLLRLEVLKPKDLFHRLTELTHSQFTSGKEVFKSPQKLNTLEYGLPSNNKYGKLPGTLFEISLNDVQLPRKELIDPSLPYYTSPVPLIRKFLDLPEMNELDGRLGHIMLYIPNFKAQLAGLLLTRQRLEIRMKSTIPWDSLVLKINYSNDSNNESETVIPKKDREIINLKFLPTALNVLLLTQQGEQIDYQEESPYHARGINSVLPKAAAQTPQFVFGSTPLDDVAEIPGMKIPMSIKSRNGERRGKKIFIIHGHNKGPKEAVARFLESLGLEPIVLHEKPNKGRTIIEKFEEHAKNVGFAIALLTGDDVGKSKKERKQRSRPRQNVIFEFGFFIGKLGRERVCGLKDKDVEVPSDYDGILYVPLDENEHWKTLLARELMSAGYRLKADKLLG